MGLRTFILRVTFAHTVFDAAFEVVLGGQHPHADGALAAVGKAQMEFGRRHGLALRVIVPRRFMLHIKQLIAPGHLAAQLENFFAREIDFVARRTLQQLQLWWRFEGLLPRAQQVGAHGAANDQRPAHRLATGVEPAGACGGGGSGFRHGRCGCLAGGL